MIKGLLSPVLEDRKNLSTRSSRQFETCIGSARYEGRYRTQTAP